MSFDDLPPKIKGIMPIISKKIGMSYAAIANELQMKKEHKTHCIGLTTLNRPNLKK